MTSMFDHYGADNIFDGFLFQQLMSVSQHSIVDIPDITGMAHSLEYRSPFLDVRMMELAMRIPAHLKVPLGDNDTQSKWILRRALQHRLPDDIVQMKKSGFGSTIPYHTWMLQDWRGQVEAKLNSPALRECGLFDVHKVNSLYQLGIMGGKVPMELIWGIVATAEWLETFF
jgi:asparagine synthase (glutamine-hydrolysing)